MNIQFECNIVKLAQVFGRGKSEDFRERIRLAYVKAHKQYAPADDSMWHAIIDKNEDLHERMLAGDSLSFLNNPSDNYMFYGFDSVFRDSTSKRGSKVLYSVLSDLGNAVGAFRLHNPEECVSYTSDEPVPQRPVEQILQAVSDIVGARIDFPNPFKGEEGLDTKRGVASYRALHAIYQAWRIKALAEVYGDRVLEIGAGLGRTAYYARKLGLRNYTIIDLPFTNVSQANFLCRVLPENDVGLYEEASTRGSLKILPASEFERLEFDVMVNVDSFTEMDSRALRRYYGGFLAKGKVMLSINHEGNRETVGEASELAACRVSRCPYWLRGGYVEELFIARS